ncbi:hypothetical protein [Candidatus Oleimmundimicrobium sp.]|uniref:hypothetical protein n=1 Tax=Candidatus Oleimmundimicrobium sp. TaxID=3060597 RepID=UPI002716C433|nr:hypothetical protein [Candidatus Oleimmundimicrobium sp.]MDO8885891.1 hypothetical protein [Candidatus Oleimmundimicrobium sp.]
MGKENYIRVPITMPNDMISYLEENSLKSKITGGHKLANTEIVRAAINAIRELNVDYTSVKNEDDLRDRILEAQARYFAKK